MKIELKNIKYAAFASQETHCYNATIYIDGKRFAHVSNDGHGGCDDVYPLDTCRREDIASWRKRLQVIETELAKNVISSSMVDSVFTYKDSLEHQCGELMNDWLQNRQIKSILRSIVYVKMDCDFGQYYNQKLKPTAANIDMIKAQSWWNDSNIVLNELPLEEVKNYI